MAPRATIASWAERWPTHSSGAMATTCASVGKVLTYWTQRARCRSSEAGLFGGRFGLGIPVDGVVVLYPNRIHPFARRLFRFFLRFFVTLLITHSSSFRSP